jgi:hypothetical protein
MRENMYSIVVGDLEPNVTNLTTSKDREQDSFQRDVHK